MYNKSTREIKRSINKKTKNVMAEVIVCKTFDELLEVVGKLSADPKDKDNYDLGRTNNVYLIPENEVLPKVKNGTSKWRFLGKSDDRRMIHFMIDRRWITVELSDGKSVIRQDFQCVRSKHPVDVLREIFEGKSYCGVENLSLSFLLFYK